MTDFLLMGGHASFIWAAYAAGVILLGGFWISSLRGLRAKEREIAALEAAVPRRSLVNGESNGETTT